MQFSFQAESEQKVQYFLALTCAARGDLMSSEKASANGFAGLKFTHAIAPQISLAAEFVLLAYC